MDSWFCQAKTEQVIQSTKDTAITARDKVANATQSTQGVAGHGQEQTTGFLQQVSSSPFTSSVFQE